MRVEISGKKNGKIEKSTKPKVVSQKTVRRTDKMFSQIGKDNTEGSNYEKQE